MSAGMSSSDLTVAIADAKAQITALKTDISGVAAILRDLTPQRAAAAADREELTKDIDYWREKESKLESLLVSHTQKLDRFEIMQLEQNGT
jgi:chromosome segregation ATPase